jgi:hypothetical protein
MNKNSFFTKLFPFFFFCTIIVVATPLRTGGARWAARDHPARGAFLLQLLSFFTYVGIPMAFAIQYWLVVERQPQISKDSIGTAFLFARPSCAKKRRVGCDSLSRTARLHHACEEEIPLPVKPSYFRILLKSSHVRVPNSPASFAFITHSSDNFAKTYPIRNI